MSSPSRFRTETIIPRMDSWNQSISRFLLTPAQASISCQEAPLGISPPFPICSREKRKQKPEPPEPFGSSAVIAADTSRLYTRGFAHFPFQEVCLFATSCFRII